jgi:epoxyqueuosine reductase
LISGKRLGSWLFLGELLIDLSLEPDQPAADHCGSCTRCIEACPTEAIVAPYLLDSRRCISYLTIELRGEIPEEFRRPMGNLIFGCDICQDVCPWNSKVASSSVSELGPREENRSPLLTELADLTRAEFSRRFARSPIKRTKRRGLLRNVAIALGNSRNPAYLPELERLLNCDEALVRSHAGWGLREIGGDPARLLVERREGTEEDLPTRRRRREYLENWDG